MSYKSDFENDAGWSAVDTNVKLNTPAGRKFRDYLRSNNVTTVIRYYASSQRSKTMSREEAKLLSSEGFNLLPVFQDINREPEDFGAAKGRSNARSAREFADMIGQPHGSTILFAADADFAEADVRRFIVPYFQAVRDEIGSDFKIGAYGSGLVLEELLDEDLIAIPWLSMSRAFRGTKEFFYANKWAFRQTPPDRTHEPSGVSYDRNVLRLTPAALGTFQVAADGMRVAAGEALEDAILGGRMHSAAGAAEIAAAEALDRRGTVAHVSTEGLNLRASPNGAIVSELTIGQPVNDLGPADVPGWRRVAVNGTEGYVFGKYLRAPAAPEVEALIAKAVAEWVRFDKGQANEKTAPYHRYVGEMWASIGENYDGRSRYPNGQDVPWSAAFISFVVRKAGSAYAQFKFAASHSKFSHDAIQARTLNRIDKPFWGYRLTEQKPAIGDIVHRNRNAGAYTFDYAENHSEFESHSDIVVEVTPNVVRVLGGNVSDTVSMAGDIQEYELDANGFIAPGQRVIAVLKNRASEI